MDFKPIVDRLFFTRNDPSDPRRGEHVEAIRNFDFEPGVVVGGYPDDEGIKNNQGRPGAAYGPESIRRYLYRMAQVEGRKVYDYGDLLLHAPLRTRHEIGRNTVRQALKKNHRWIGIGGGHDYGYADGAGFLDWNKLSGGARPIIINFDAHLDVRKPADEINSGTPFYRLSELGIPYDFVQIGIQDQCNSVEHVKWSRSKGHVIIRLDDFWSAHVSLTEFLVAQLGDLLGKRRPCFVSVDIDAFSWPYAIGCSQSWPTGLSPRDFWPAFNLILERLDVRVLGIYETAPPLDIEGGTAKLAAQIADTFIRARHA